MKLINSITIFLLPLFAQSQSISFSPAEELFTHPMINHGNKPFTENPFIPIDFNNDGLTDFVGHGRTGTFDHYTYFLQAESETSFTRDSIDTGSSISDVAQVIDYDRDGLEDILLTDQIYFFTDKEPITIPLPNNYDDFVTSDKYLGAYDFNGDETLDIVVRRIISGDLNEFALYLSNTDTSYQNVVLTPGDDFADFKVTDINNDGFLDIANVFMSNSDAVAIDLYFNDGTGKFTVQSLSTFNYFSIPNIFAKLELDDIDADGDIDIIFTDQLQEITILENEGQISNSEFNFKAPPFTSPLDLNFRTPITYSIGDFNGDSLQDFIILDEMGTLYYSENLGGLNFTEPVVIAETSEPLFVYNQDRYFDISKANNNLNIYDYDADGDLDVLYMDGELGSQLLIRNEGITTPTQNYNHTRATVYPNPTSERLFIKSDYILKEADLLDSKGSILSNFKLGAKFQELDLRDYGSGLYFLRIFSEKHSNISKFIIN